MTTTECVRFQTVHVNRPLPLKLVPRQQEPHHRSVAKCKRAAKELKVRIQVDWTLAPRQKGLNRPGVTEDTRVANPDSKDKFKRPRNGVNPQHAPDCTCVPVSANRGKRVHQDVIRELCRQFSRFVIVDEPAEHVRARAGQGNPEGVVVEVRHVDGLAPGKGLDGGEVPRHDRLPKPLLVGH